MSEVNTLARMLAPAAQPMGRQNMLARLLLEAPPTPEATLPPTPYYTEARTAEPQRPSWRDIVAQTLDPNSRGNRIAMGFTGPAAIRAFHGSPHRFERFDMSRIGTGEGAQAFGHGLYFAGAEDVARGYRDTLARETYRTSAGNVWSPDSLRHLNVRNAARRDGIDGAIARAESLLPNAPAQTAPLLRADLNELRALRDAGGISPNPGHMYEVRLNTTPNRLLDWDAPLARQAPETQRALMNLPQSHRFNPDWSGANLYESSVLVPGATRDAAAAAQTLRGAGVDGIRYLDAGSRGAGQGTRNYVMFDDSLIDIIRRYGIAGMLGGGAAAGAAMEGQ